MFSVIIPTLWKSHRTASLLADLENCPLVGEIIIIDNANSGYQSNGKIKIVSQKCNIFVNPAWNLGVKLAKYEQICIANDDINFDTDIFSYLNGRIEGVIGMDANNYSAQKSGIFATNRIRERCWGWGCLFFVNKRDWIDIPEQLLIACGDDYLISQLPAYMVSNLAIQTEVSTTSFSIEFFPIQEQDAINFKQL